MEGLVESIDLALPELDSETKQVLVNTIIDMGPRNMEDIIMIEEDDLKSVLPIMQRRRLLKYWKQHGMY
jgi:hypothetical protein